jgi:hypothetical protein
MPSGASVLRIRGGIRPEEWLGVPGRVYIGRACWGWAASPFANPFRDGPAADAFLVLLTLGADDAIEFAMDEGCRLARGYSAAGLPRHRDRLVARLPGLLGKALGCWCAEWRPDPGLDQAANLLRAPGCHGVALLAALEGWITVPGLLLAPQPEGASFP